MYRAVMFHEKITPGFIKPIVNHGNAKAIIIDRSIWLVAGFDPDKSKVRINIEGGKLVLRPA